jgi:2'-5' RNA ligase
VALVVVGYPSISKHDFDWIQLVRSQHDDQFKIIAPHFTLVFPCRLKNQQDLINHVQARVKGIPPIPFSIKKVIAVKDRLSENTHLFLTPEEGSNAILKLHDRLYTDILASELNRDVPFIPHITLGKSLDPDRIQRLAAEINTRNLAIKGTLDTLVVASFDGQQVKTLAYIQLEDHD